MNAKTFVTAAFLLVLAVSANVANADGSLKQMSQGSGVALSEAASPEFDLLRSYYTYDDIPLEAETLTQEALGNTVREKIRFRSFDRAFVTAYLAKPNGVKKPPVVILLHGIGQSKDQWWLDGGPWSFPSRHREVLLANGIAVLAIDARSHGERILAHDFANPLAYLEKGYFEAAKKMVAESALDVRRAIDYLQTRDDVDASRLGVAGFSLGAHIAWIVTAVDPRINRSLIMAMPFLPPPREQNRSFTAPENFLPGFEGRHIMLLAATKDNFYTRDQVTQLFEKIPTATKELKWVESGHDLPASTASLSKYWFVGKL